MAFVMDAIFFGFILNLVQELFQLIAAIFLCTKKVDEKDFHYKRSSLNSYEN